MNKIGSALEDKLEEFRISGKHPSYIGLTKEVHDALNEEIKAKRGYRVQTIGTRVIEFLGLDVITMSGLTMPKDGIYIHPKEW